MKNMLRAIQMYFMAMRKPDAVKMQLKLLNEILSIATFSRNEDGSLYISEAKGYVVTVKGNVVTVEGNVGDVKGDVHGTVGGNVLKVRGRVFQMGSFGYRATFGPKSDYLYSVDRYVKGMDTPFIRVDSDDKQN